MMRKAQGVGVGVGVGVGAGVGVVVDAAAGAESARVRRGRRLRRGLLPRKRRQETSKDDRVFQMRASMRPTPPPPLGALHSTTRAACDVIQ